MNKERLEELLQRYYSSRKMDAKETLAIMIVAKYGKHLLKQAERVRELEEKFEERENELIRILTNRYKCIIQLENTEIILSEKIKRYREAIKKAMKLNIDENYNYDLDKLLHEALEGESNG